MYIYIYIHNMYVYIYIYNTILYIYIHNYMIHIDIIISNDVYNYAVGIQWDMQSTSINHNIKITGTHQGAQGSGCML